MIPKTSIVPPGGFHFDDVSSGIPVRIEGTSHDEVVANVLKWRTQHALPPGDPLEEYRAQLCGKWPHFCVGGTPVVQPTMSGGEHISRRVATWMSAFVRGYRDAHPVPQEVANARAATCAACPHNVVYNATGCAPCLESIEQLAFITKANKATPSDPALRACSVLAQHNGTAVWAATLPPVPAGAQLPPNCWRKSP